jgi:hypothetical protein
MNNAADAHKQFWQSCIVSGISVGLSALGWGLSKIPALGNIAEELLAGGSAAGNILSRGGKMAFDAIDANRDYGIMETMDPQQIVLRALKRHAEATGQVFEISAEELKVLTQITQELINSMQYGTWGINSGLYDYFTSLMETVYRIQEMLFMLGQTKHKIRSEARQTVSGKAISSASLDASTLLSADSTKALGFVSDLFSGLEMIVEQHNKMVAAEREMYLDLLDIATTTATSMVNLKLQGASADLEKMTKEAEDLAALENTAVENNASDETLETIRTQYLDKQQEIGALELEIQGQKNTYSLMSIAQPWVRMLVGAGIDKLLTREHQKESVTIKVDTTSSDELTNMEQKALAASLSQGTSAQQSTTTATSHERWQQVTDASWDAVVEIAKYVATQIDNKYKNEAAVVESQQEEYINKCEDAVRTAKQLEEMLTSLQTPLDDNPENVRATIETVQALGQEAARLQEQIEIAEASKYEARKYSEEAKQGKVSLTLPASSGQAQLTQFQTELQQASTALQAYLETLIAQTADTKEGSPTTAPQNPAEAKATAEESLTVLQQSASQVFESEAVMAGLSHLVAPEDATRIQQTIISSDGRPIESLSEEENWAILGRDRLLLAGLTENNQQEAVQRLQGRVDELQRAIDQVLAGKDMVPKGIKSGDYVKMLQAENERVMEQIAQAKSGSKWDAIKGVACEMNSITYILRMQIRTRLSNPQQTPANHPNRITGSMTALEVLGCIDREFDAQMAARFGITMPAGASTPMLAPVTNPRGQAEQLVPEDMPATESEPISEDVSDEFSALENELDEALVQLSTRSSEAILQGYLEQKRLRAATRAAENRATAELADLDSQDLPALQALLADQTQQESEIKDQLEQYDVALATMVQDLACDPATLEAVNQNLTGWLGSLSSLKGEILC